MPNDYFNYPTPAGTAHTLGRIGTVDAVFNSIVAGFNKLPTEAEIKENRVNDATTGGSANVYTLTLPYPITAYVDGLTLSVEFHAANTGASTINVDGLGAKVIKQFDGNDVVAGDLPAGTGTTIRYNGTEFRLTGASPGSIVSAAASATAAATSEANAATSESNAAASASAAATSESNAATSEANAAASAAALHVLQSKSTLSSATSTGTTVIPLDDTIPQNTEGTELLTVSITPNSASNQLIIEGVLLLSATTAGRDIVVALFKDSDAGALAAWSDEINDANDGLTFPFRFRMIAGTTSAITFKVRAGPAVADTITFNGKSGSGTLGGVEGSIITVTEIKV